MIYKNLNYDLLTDLVPIARLPPNPLLVVTSDQVPAKDLKELVDYLKANADKIPGGTAGIGSGSHLGALAFFAATGTNYQLVPYRGTGPAMQDLIANQIQIMVDQSANSLPQVRAGKIKAYAVDRQGANGGGAGDPDRGRGRLSRWRSRSGTACGRPRARRRRSSPGSTPPPSPPCRTPTIRRRMEDLGQDIPTPAEMAPAAFAAFQQGAESRRNGSRSLDKANVKVE